jgi:hypothetical protein
MKFFKALIVSLCVAAAIIPAAQASVVDFNNTSGGGYQYFYPAYSSGGLTFTLVSEAYLIGTGYSGTNQTSYYAINGTDYLMSDSDITITKTGGGTFSLNSLDMTPWEDYSGISQAILTGARSAGASVSKTVTFTGDTANSSNVSGNDFTKYLLSGFDNLTSLTISHGGGYLAIDNVTFDQTSAVPEPSSIALLGLAFAGFAAVRRRVTKR